MRRWAILLVVCGLAGCGTDTTTRFAAYERAVGQLQAASAEIDNRLAAIDAFLATAQTALSDPNLGSSSAEILAGIEAAIAKRDQAIEAKTKIDAALAQVRAQIEQIRAEAPIDVGDEMELIGGGLAAAGQASGGKTGAWLVAIGSVIAAAAGVIRGNRAASAAQHVTQKVIASVDTLLGSPLVTDAKQAKELLAHDQGTAIATAVKSIKEG
ncbi:MAG: hypothetical protein GXY19_16020 [Phycisphaerae bacterium]|nr:hypothetical protein [Phycisphaerae bacterium]